MIFLTTYPIVMLRALYCMIERLFPSNYRYVRVIKYCLLREKNYIFLQVWVSRLYVPLTVSGSACLPLNTYRSAKERTIETGKDLWKLSDQTPSKTNQTRSSFKVGSRFEIRLCWSEPCPVKFWVSLRMELLQAVQSVVKHRNFQGQSIFLKIRNVL